MTKEDWKQVTSDSETFPGPRAFLVSGYDPPQIEALRGMLDDLGYGDVPVRCCAAQHMEVSVEQALSAVSDEAPLGQGKLPYTLVVSGMTAVDAGTVMGNFSTSGLPRPIFAASTETNLGFTVKHLLRHLLAEQRAVREAAEQGR